MIKNVFTVGFWTLASRVFGMGREVLLFALIGAGPLLDAFFAAFRLPNMFRRFFAEGAFNAGFVPIYSRKVAADQTPDNFASNALSGLSVVVLVLTGLAMIFMPALVWATANGFVGDARFDMTVTFGRIMFPYILLLSIAALVSGTLNARGRFAAAAAAPVMLNVLIIGALTITWLFDGPYMSVLVWTIPVAGIVQLAIVWIAAQRAGIALRYIRPRWDADMKNLVTVAIPAALSGGVLQINLLVGQWVSSQYEGAVSWLYGADRLYQLPLGVIGIGVGIVLLPELSKKLQLNDETGARAAFSKAGEIILVLSLPASVALCVVPLPLVSALYEHGATTRQDAIAMAQATAIYGLGLPAFMLQKLLQPLFYARSDTRTPFRLAVVSMCVNAVLAIGLMPWIGWMSAAIATTTSAWVMVILLWLASLQFGTVAKFEEALTAKILRIIFAACLMGGALYGLDYAATPLLTGTLARIIYGLALVPIGVVVFFAIAHVIGAVNISHLKSAIRRA